MAQDPKPTLIFDGRCPDCGRREVFLPDPLPAVGDDFDWDLRDYDGFRLFMMQELAARFPERRRWTAADVEVALIEVLAFGLDQLSDQLDRTASESYLGTARRPESLRRLLNMIGYDALGLAKRLRQSPFDVTPAAKDTRTDIERFDDWWLDHPDKMDQARLDGPRAIHDQHRMVTLDDFITGLEAHPLILRAYAWDQWDGSWPTVHVAVIPWRRLELDEDGVFSDDVWAETQTFHAMRGLFLPQRQQQPSVRGVLYPYLESYRLVGQEVVLESAVKVGITMSLSIQVDSNYFQSEIRRTVEHALGTGPNGFFEPGRLRFGEDLWASDLYQVLMDLDGVGNVCLNRFKRLGDRFPDQAAEGRIVLEGLEVAICDNDPAHPEFGYYTLMLYGGRKG